MSQNIGSFLAGIAILAVIYMLVRPGMPAAQAVQDLSNVLAAMVRSATGSTPLQATLV